MEDDLYQQEIQEKEDKTPSKFKLSKANIERAEELKKGVTEFFYTKYGIEVSKKLAKQHIEIYHSNSNEEYGFVSSDDLNLIMMNEIVLEDESLFETTLIHETMHQLGCSNLEMGHFMNEGFAEALTQEATEFLNIKYQTEGDYEIYADLAEQMIIANPTLIAEIIMNEDFDFVKHFNDVLKDVPQEINELAVPGKRFIEIMDFNYWEGDDSFMAQEFVSVYVRNFDLSKKQIKRIRQRYIIPDYELYYY